MTMGDSFNQQAVSCEFPHCGCYCGLKGTYSAETYVGNWYEDTVKNTLKREDFLRKRECEDLLIQRSQIMVDTLLKPCLLTARTNGFVHYGDSVQIVFPGPDCCTDVSNKDIAKMRKLSHLALSASVSINEIDFKPFLDTDSIITSSPHLYPVVRNSFVIEQLRGEAKSNIAHNPECPERKGPLNFGDVFRIRAMPTQQWPLYLHCAPAIKFHSAALHSGKPLVRFSDTKNPNTLFCCQPLDCYVKLRMPLGVPVPMKERMTIQHAISGQNLSLEPNYHLMTYFGCEYEVSVETKRDKIRRISFENHCVFDTERGWPKVEQTDREFVEKAKFAAAINADSVNKMASQDEKQLDDNITYEEQTPEECYMQQKEQELQAAAFNNMIQRTIEENCSPRQRRPTDPYPAFPGKRSNVYLSEIPLPERTPCQIKLEEAQIGMEKLKLQLEEEYAKKKFLDTAIPGYVTAHDPSTSPQPHAHQHTLSENQEFFPNRRFNCGNTQCGYPRATIP